MTSRSSRFYEPNRFWWLIGTTVMVLLVGVGTFFLATQLRKVDENERLLRKTCELRNNRVIAINEKFAQLNFLFDTALKNRPPDQPPPTEEVLRAYEAFKKPIPLVPC